MNQSDSVFTSPGPPRIQESTSAFGQDIVQPLQQLVEISVNLLNADKGSLQLYDERERVLKIITHSGFNEKSVEEFRSIPVDLSVRSFAAKARPLAAAEASATQSAANEFAPDCPPDGHVAIQTIPLLSGGGEVIGALSMHFSPPHHPSERERGLLELCAQHASQWIEHQRLTQELRVDAKRIAQQIADLEQKHADVARANRNFERFATAVGHDLRETLSKITTHTDLLAQHSAGKTPAVLSNIVQEIARMRELLAELLMYAEIGSSEETSAEHVDLNVVLERVVKNLKASIDETGAAISSPTLPSLLGRDVHFVQLFQNLIGNAIKRRTGTPPRIQISTQGIESGVEFAVHDNGIASVVEHHESIFKPFKSLQDNREPDTGVGFAVCQRVVERYGGRIWVESQGNHEPTFRFTFPNVVVQPVGDGSFFDVPPGGKVRVLYVDDSPGDVDLVRLALRQAEFDCDLTVIGDGEEALAFIRQEEKYCLRQAPDLVVLDLHLPKHDGIEILQALSTKPEFRAVPVAVLSADVSPLEAAEMLPFRIARFITKPSNLEDFLEIGTTLKGLLTEKGTCSQASAGRQT